MRNITQFDNAQAAREGWSIFSATSDGCPFQLQRCDDAEVFETDGAAVEFVVDKAIEGSEYHVSALRYLREHSPLELKNFPAFARFLDRAKSR